MVESTVLSSLRVLMCDCTQSNLQDMVTLMESVQMCERTQSHLEEMMSSMRPVQMCDCTQSYLEKMMNSGEFASSLCAGDAARCFCNACIRDQACT